MDETQKKRPLWFRIMRGLLVLLLTLMLLGALAAWWLLGTSSGATWLVGTALPYAQDNMPESLQLTVDGIEADTVAKIRIGRIALADEEGEWFEAEALALHWSPAALWHMTVDVQELSARRIRFIRPPVGEETPAQPLREQIEAAQNTLRQLPDTLSGINLPPVKIDQLRIDELAIDMIPLRLSVNGSADLTRLPAQLDLQANSIDGVETRAMVKLSGDMQNATLTLAWNEGIGGLLGRALPLSTPAPLALNVKAMMQDGKLAHDLSLNAGEAELLQGKIDLPMVEDEPLLADLTLPNPALLAPLPMQTQPIHAKAKLQDNLLTARLHTNAYLLNEEQTLVDATIDTRLAFEDDPLFALKIETQAVLLRPESGAMPLALKLKAEGDAMQWQVTSLTATAPDMQANAEGSLDLEAGEAQLSGKAQLPQLDAQFTADLANLLEQPQGRVELVLESLKMELPAPLDSVLKLPLTLTAETQANDAPLPDVAITLASENLNGDGMLYPNADENDPLAALDLKVGGLPVPLTLRADYSAAGTGHVEAKSKTLHAATDYVLRDEQVALKQLQIDAGKAISLAGEITLNTATTLAKGNVKGHIRSTAPLQDLGLPLPLVEMDKGTIDIQLTAPDGVQVADAGFTTGAITLDGQEMGENIVLESHAELPNGKAPQLRALLMAENMVAPLALEEMTLAIKSNAEKWDWTLAMLTPDGNGLNAQGNLTLAEEILLAIGMLNGTWGDGHQIISTKTALVSYGGDAVTVRDVNLVIDDDSTIAAEAELSNTAVQGSLNIDALPLGILPVAQLEGMRGVLGARLTLSGSPQNPTASLAADIEGLQQNYPQMAKLSEQPLMVKLRGELKNSEISAQLSANAPDAESFAAANFGIPLRLSLMPGAFSAEPGERIDAALKADLLLGPFLPLFLPDGIYASGHLVADIRVGGTLANPRLQGDIDLHSAQVEVLQAGTVIEGLQAKVQARDDRITISDGQATDGDKGKLTFGGSLRLAESLPMDFKANLSQFVALRHPSATATLSGDTALSGDLTDALLKGDWQINGAKITITPASGGDVTELDVVEVDSLDAPLEEPEEVAEMTAEERAAAREQRRKERPFTRNLNLALSIGADNQIFLDGFGLTAELKGKVDISGTAARPKLGGKMETVRGRWEFFGRTFTITRGEAQLSENNLTAPLINIRAEADADDVLAIAQITGTTDNPKIEFSSIPALPRDEVLSRVMFGENLNNISPYQALQLADMLRSLSGSGNGSSINPLSKLQNTLGIDELKINSDSGNNEDVTVGVGKYVQENVYLEVEGGAGEDSGKVSVEVDLTPNISVETEARQTADTAVRLNYKYDY